MISPQTLNELFFGAIDAFGRRPAALRAKVAGRWTDISYQDLLDRVQATATGLLELGIRAGDRVAILSENRPEWAVADFACLSIRAADVPIYPTLPPKQIEYILRDSGCSAIFISAREQLDKIHEIKTRLPDLQNIIMFEDVPHGEGVLTLRELADQGRASLARHPRWRADALQVGSDDLATLVYTSGTTGDPKGVMLTHGNIASNVSAGLQVLDLGEGDECLSFLPLSHIFERMAGHYAMFAAGAVINYAVSIDTVTADIVDRRPTVVLSVPRLYEKIYARVLDGAVSGSGIKKRIFFWAKRTGESWAEYRLAGRAVPRGLAMQYALAHKLVFSKLHARMGGRLRFFCSGGAPLAADIAKFFYAAGLPILEGYGLTETSPVITVNRIDALKFGTVGRVVPGVEVRIAPDGEILTRGPHVMKGYYKKPEATAEAIDPDGWFHTGDIGVIDSDGFLKITDRKKDIIVTAGGKNIAPQPIENLVKSNKFVSNAVMLGDRRKFPIMLIVPNFDNLKTWAAQQALDYVDNPSLLARPEVRLKMEQEVQATLQELAHFEMPKKLLLIPQDFTIESGELTPKLSVRRKVVEHNNLARIDQLYAETDTANFAISDLT